MQHLHRLVETELEAPALAWNILAYYWGMSTFGLGPAYQEYMQSDEAELDKAWNAVDNEGLNQIAGLRRNLTIRERFDRAANFYVYCYEQGVKHSINPPFDMPPTTDDLVQTRMRMESKAQPQDKTIEATSDSLLDNHPELQKLWALGAQERRQQRAEDYNARIIESLQYIASEIHSLTSLTPDQLDETGFLVEGHTGQRYNVTADLMDEAMSGDVQDKKFGECYIRKTPEGIDIITSGIFGAYYNMGHNLEMAMFDEESKIRLSSIHHAVMLTWRQLYEINQKENL